MQNLFSLPVPVRHNYSYAVLCKYSLLYWQVEVTRQGSHTAVHAAHPLDIQAA